MSILDLPLYRQERPRVYMRGYVKLVRLSPSIFKNTLIAFASLGLHDIPWAWWALVKVEVGIPYARYPGHRTPSPFLEKM